MQVRPESTPKDTATHGRKTQSKVEDPNHHLIVVIALHTTTATIGILILVERELQLPTRDSGHWSASTGCGSSRIAVARRIVQVTKLWVLIQFFTDFGLKGILKEISLKSLSTNVCNSPRSRQRRHKSDCHLHCTS